MKTLNKRGVAERLGMSVRKVERMVAQREFPPPMRQGRHCVWVDACVERWLSLQVEAQLAWFDVTSRSELENGMD